MYYREEGSDEWVHAYTHDPGPGQFPAGAVFRFVLDGPSRPFEVDNVVVIPEPGTLSLLILGVIWSSRRKCFA